MTKLNKAEKAWIAKLQAILDQCPSDRLGFYTIGDPSVAVYDRSKDDSIYDLMDSGKQNDFCLAVNAAGARTDFSIDFPSNVHSTSG